MPNPLNRVVVHCMDGRILKGITQDFYPNRSSFHVAPEGRGKTVKVDARKLKAVFFVHDTDGNRARKDRQGFLGGPMETRHGGRVAVLFKDGELVCGYSLGCRPDRDGFFLFPADEEGNNARIFVYRAATEAVDTGADAEALASRVMRSRAA